MTVTTNLGIALLEQSQAQKEITVNEALVRLDAILNTGAISKAINDPPASPATGDLYIVGDSPTGTWAAKAGQLAYFDQTWRFIAPKKGMLMSVNDEDVLYNYDGENWVTTISSGGTGTVTSVSVATANGVSGSVANPTTTPQITLTLGDIVPGSVTASGAVTGSNLSGTNTGDQTITLTGDVTGSGAGSFAATIANGAITPPKLATSIIPYLGDGISGLTLAVNATDPNNDTDFDAGFCIDSARTYPLHLVSAMTKRLDASWAEGNNAGGLFSGSKASNTTYHCFLIRKDSDGSIDAGFDTSVTAANIPSGYSAYRWLGAIMTDGSSNIRKFFQNGDYFFLDVPIRDITATNPGTSAVTRTLTVPAGVSVMAQVVVGLRCNTSADINYILTSLEQTDTAPSSGGVASGRAVNSSTGVGITSACHLVRTNTSGQIRSRQDASGASDAFFIVTQGWHIRRSL